MNITPRFSAIIAAFTAALALLTSLPAQALPPLDRPAPAQDISPHDIALVIGVADYAFVSSVDYADRDARAFASYLLQTRSLAPERVRILINDRASRESIEEGVQFLLENAHPEGTVWVFFAGHGIPDPRGGDGLLAGTDVQRTVASVQARSISRQWLIDELGRANAERAVVFLDACFSGHTHDGEPLLEEGLRPLVPVANLGSTSGVLVFSAAGEDETSGPLHRAEQGLFSYFAIGGLRGWADLDGDGEVTADELDRYIRRALAGVLIDGSRPQNPRVNAYGTDDRLNWVLASAVSERGPDLAELTLSMLSEDRSEPLPNPHSLASIPTLSGRLRPGGAVDFEIAPEVLVAYDRALTADGHGDENPTGAARAWENVAAHQERNPYRDEARERADQWQALADYRRAYADQLARDVRNLENVLPLSSVADAHKEQLLENFADVYGREAMVALIDHVEPHPLRRQLCRDHLDIDQGAEVTVQMPYVGGEVHRGRIHVDGRDVGQAPSTLTLPTCAQIIEVRDLQGRSWAGNLHLTHHGEPLILRPTFDGVIADGSPEYEERLRRQRPRSENFFLRSELAPLSSRWQPALEERDVMLQFGMEANFSATTSSSSFYLAYNPARQGGGFGLNAGFFSRYGQSWQWTPLEAGYFQGFFSMGTTFIFNVATRYRHHLGGGFSLGTSLGIALEASRGREGDTRQIRPVVGLGVDWGP